MGARRSALGVSHGAQETTTDSARSTALHSLPPAVAAFILRTRVPFDSVRVDRERRLGAGSFGAVYGASHTELPRSIVAKLHNLKKPIGDHAVGLSFAAEIVAYAHLMTTYPLGQECDAIRPCVPFYAWSISADRATGFIVVGEGTPLTEQRLQGMSTTDRLRACLDVVAAVLRIHAPRRLLRSDRLRTPSGPVVILHRDIRPHNFVFVPTGDADRPRLCLVDFGMARVLDIHASVPMRFRQPSSYASRDVLVQRMRGIEPPMSTVQCDYYLTLQTLTHIAGGCDPWMRIAEEMHNPELDGDLEAFVARMKVVDPRPKLAKSVDPKLRQLVERFSCKCDDEYIVNVLHTMYQDIAAALEPPTTVRAPAPVAVFAPPPPVASVQFQSSAAPAPPAGNASVRAVGERRTRGSLAAQGDNASVYVAPVLDESLSKRPKRPPPVVQKAIAKYVLAIKSNCDHCSAFGTPARLFTRDGTCVDCGIGLLPHQHAKAVVWHSCKPTTPSEVQLTYDAETKTMCLKKMCGDCKKPFTA